MVRKSGETYKLALNMILMALACLIIWAGINLIASQSKTTFFYLTGTVESAAGDHFDLAVIPEESNVDVKLENKLYRFNINDFTSDVYLPEEGEKIRITCSHDMTVLVGIYRDRDLQDQD